MRFQFIATHAPEFRVTTMCRVLQVSKAGYYAWKDRAPSRRAQSNQGLLRRIQTIYTQSRGTYGSPRITAELRAGGMCISPQRVARLMRTTGLVAIARRRRLRGTVRSSASLQVADNLLNRQFTVATVNRVWASDMTYIPTHEGWLYLAVVLDLASRRVIGWAMHSTPEQTVALEALQMAITHRGATAGVLHHSDRGSQYTSAAYQALLTAQGMTSSLSRKGNCWDNAVAESFFATLKTELVPHAMWTTRAMAKRALFEYIEVWYNRHRRHSSLDYRSPVEYELTQLDRAA